MLVVVAARKIARKYSHLPPVNRIANSLTFGYPRGAPLQVDCGVERLAENTRIMQQLTELLIL
jgi:hypothetical protein